MRGAWDRLGVNRVGQGRLAEGAQLWKISFSQDRSCSVHLDSGHPLAAACFAARAGTGQDRGDLDAATQAAWRAQALDWLSARLRLLWYVSERGRGSTVEILERWQQAEALAPLWEAVALEALPESERREWRALWSAVSELRRSLQ